MDEMSKSSQVQKGHTNVLLYENMIQNGQKSRPAETDRCIISVLGYVQILNQNHFEKPFAHLLSLESKNPKCKHKILPPANHLPDGA